jgi:Cu+-exporting ATPase
MKNLTIPVHGMDCASCALTIEKTLKKVDGVAKCEVNYATEKAKIEFDEEKIDIEKLSKKIEPLGYSLMKTSEHSNMEHGEMQHEGHDHNKMLKEEELKAMRNKMQVAMPLTLLVFILMLWEILAANIMGFPMMIIPERIYVTASFILASVFITWLGANYVKAIIPFIKYRVANMDTLVGIGTLTAYIYSSLLFLFPELIEIFKLNNTKYFDVTIVVIGFITFGKYLEHSSKYRTGEAIKKLLNIQAKTAILIISELTSERISELKALGLDTTHNELEISINHVQVGDVIAIKPGSKVPVDGEIVSGSSSIDESMITGEPIPVDKTTGDLLTGGTINKQGYLKMRTTKVGDETMLSQIIKMVEEAQGSRAPIQNLADKISEIFVPTVLVIAVVSLIAWIAIGSQFLPFDQAFSFGLLSFVGVLVIACPCALGLATPTAIIVGVGLGAENGILIKDAESLEKLNKVKMLVMDKTGTITKGKPDVTDVIAISNQLSADSLLEILASIEIMSEHPIAQAIVEHAKEKNINLQEVESFKNFEGKGVSGVIKGVKYFAGNRKILEEINLKVNEEKINELTSQGKTIVIIADEKEILGIIGVSDTLKENAISTIKELHKLGVKIAMLTGDDKLAANYIANQIGIDEVYANVLPTQKAEIVKDLKQKYSVAMAGDGINDAPALALADVGIAMGTGTDVAIEAADITLLGGDISKIAKAFKLSRFTIRTIKENLFWAFIYNIIGIPLAAGLFYPFFKVILNPAFAGGAMALSSVSVVLNSLRLRLSKL